MPKMKRPFDMWSIIATSPATRAGWWFGMLTVPLPSLICFVSFSSHATKISDDVIVSAASVTCSPMNPSTKPSWSARMVISRSSCSVSPSFRPTGWTGIAKKPSFILSSPGTLRLRRAGAAAPAAERGARARNIRRR